MIGKNFREVTKDKEHKGRGRRAEGNLQERGENRFADRNALGERTLERDNMDNSGQLLQSAPPNQAARVLEVRHLAAPFA